MTMKDKPDECSICHRKEFWLAKWGFVCESCHPDPNKLDKEFKKNKLGESNVANG